MCSQVCVYCVPLCYKYFEVVVNTNEEIDDPYSCLQRKPKHIYKSLSKKVGEEPPANLNYIPTQSENDCPEVPKYFRRHIKEKYDVVDEAGPKIRKFLVCCGNVAGEQVVEVYEEIPNRQNKYGYI